MSTVLTVSLNLRGRPKRRFMDVAEESVRVVGEEAVEERMRQRWMVYHGNAW